MRRLVVIALVCVFLFALGAPVAFAGVEPSPFRSLGLVKDLWTPSGQMDAFVPQTEPQAFSVKGQWLSFDPQPEPPGRVKDMWTAPGRTADLVREPMPPAHTPVIQATIILY